jgi:AraC-like DNA-binding protein
MLFRPIEKSKTYFLGLLDSLLDAEPPSHVWLADSLVCNAQPGDPILRIKAAARFSIMLEGRFPFTISRRGQRREIEWCQGQALYLARHAWSLEHRDEPCAFFGVVFLSGCVRFLLADLEKPNIPSVTTPWTYHTAHPISEAGAHATWALDALAEQDDSEATLPLLITLLHLVREHLQRDEPSHEEYSGRASNTWRRVWDYLHENYSQSISRASVAKALHLHPNYLSALCAREGGVSFHQALEAIRIERARHLLQQADLDMERIARLCGFSNAPHLTRSFRRVTGVTPSDHRDALP